MLINNKAFTLAEILITLTIIGIIAAITIPAVTTEIQDAQLKTAWKQAYAQISQATSMLNTKNEGIDFTNSSTMRSDYAKVMNFTRQDNMQNIFAPYYFFYKSHQGIDFTGDGTTSAILLNGNLIRFYSYGLNGGSYGSVPNSGLCTTFSGSLTGICGDMAVDINGIKGPNMYGKDLFWVRIVKNHGNYLACAIGANEDGYSCSSGSTISKTSQGCSALALYADKMP